MPDCLWMTVHAMSSLSEQSALAENTLRKLRKQSAHEINTPHTVPNFK